MQGQNNIGAIGAISASLRRLSSDTPDNAFSSSPGPTSPLAAPFSITSIDNPIKIQSTAGASVLFEQAESLRLTLLTGTLQNELVG